MNAKQAAKYSVRELLRAAVRAETNYTPQHLQGRQGGEACLPPAEPGELAEREQSLVDEQLLGFLLLQLPVGGRGREEGAHVCLLWATQSAWAGQGCPRRLRWA